VLVLRTPPYSTQTTQSDLLYAFKGEKNNWRQKDREKKKGRRAGREGEEKRQVKSRNMRFEESKSPAIGDVYRSYFLVSPENQKESKREVKQI